MDNDTGCYLIAFHTQLFLNYYSFIMLEANLILLTEKMSTGKCLIKRIDIKRTDMIELL